MAGMRIVKVRWVDSRAWSGWNDQEEVKRWANEPGSDEINTIGLLMEENEKHILLVQSEHGESGIGNAFMIPRGAVLKMEYLDE